MTAINVSGLAGLLMTGKIDPRMSAKSAPLNGTKTHPLTAHARGVLQSVARQPIPTQEINAGVRDRFHRQKLTETVRLPSPYKVHKGGTCDHEQITAAGRAALASQ